VRKGDTAVVGKKLTHYESSVRGCIVIVEQTIACAPQFRSFSPNVLAQTAKNIAVELSIHGLAFGTKFMVHNAESFPHFWVLSSWKVALTSCRF
jgi:hypothetical protein